MEIIVYPLQTAFVVKVSVSGRYGMQDCRLNTGLINTTFEYILRDFKDAYKKIMGFKKLLDFK